MQISSSEMAFPRWFKVTGQAILLLFLMSLPFLYDITVPEVAGDIRWYVTHFVAMLLTTLGLLATGQQKTRLNFALPLFVCFLLALGVVAVISYLDTVNPYRSWISLKHFLAYLALAYWVYALRDLRFYRLICWALVLPILPVVWLGIVQFLNWNSATVGGWDFGMIDWARVAFPQSAPPAGTFANKNLAASWLVAVLPVAWGLWVNVKRVSARIFLSVILGSGLVFLVFGRSRASMLAYVFAAVLLVLWVLLQPALRAAIWRQFSGSHAVLLVLICGSVWWCFPMKTGLQGGHGIGASVGEQMANLKNLNDYGPRIAYNLNGLKMTADNPLTGVGIGAFHTAYPPYFDALYTTPTNGYNVTARPQRAHNDLMQAFIELGILGGVLHVVLLGFVLLTGWRLVQAAPLQALKGDTMPAFITIGVLGLSLNALGDFPLQMATAPQILFICFGVLTGIGALVLGQTGAGMQGTLRVPRGVWLVCAAGMAWATVYVTQENLAQREGAQFLKLAMARNMAGLMDDETLRLIDASYDAYQGNARMQEFRGIIYMHYRGQKNMTEQQRLEALNLALQHDHFAANHNINKASLLHRMAMAALGLGDRKTAVRYLDTVEFEIMPILMQVAPFSYHTYNLWGAVHLLRGRREAAKSAFLEAQRILPNEPVSLQNLKGLGVAVTQTR